MIGDFWQFGFGDENRRCFKRFLEESKGLPLVDEKVSVTTTGKEIEALL